ncbi:hypothetical protein HOY80DRAFT_1040159 [Tuber brumale]|nr:hypothetical protein HOY80DRAFT_1040159 [Tuber brumale]
MVFKTKRACGNSYEDTGITPTDIREQVDSAARELMLDAAGALRLVNGLKEYKKTLHESTWKTVLKYVYELRGYEDGQTNGGPPRLLIKIAIFSATLQSNG